MPFLNKSDVYDICIKDYSNLTIDDMIYMGPDKNRDVKELSKQIFDL